MLPNDLRYLRGIGVGTNLKMPKNSQRSMDALFGIFVLFNT